MMADRVAQAFSAIKTKHERRNALQKLLHAVDFDEREYIFSMLSMSCDPLLVLPVEIVLKVFRHLSVFCTWNLRRVRKSWQQVLSSPDFLRQSLSLWDTHGPSDSARSAETIRNTSLDSRLMHLKALKTGRHLSHEIIDNTGTGLQGPQPQLSLLRVDLMGNRIAYISSHPRQGDAVVVRHLSSGEEKILRGDAREGIVTIILTTRLTAWITFDGSLYVAYHDKSANETTRVQLPSSRVRTAAGSEEMIAMCLGGATGDNAYISELLLYNAGTGHLQSFNLQSNIAEVERSGRRLNSCTLLVNSRSQHVNLFLILEKIRLGVKYVRVSQSLISFRGSWWGSTVWEQEVDYQHSGRETRYLLAPPHPTGIRDEYRIAVYETAFMGGLPFRLTGGVLFNAAGGRLVAVDPNDPVRRAGDRDRGRPVHVLWKGQKHFAPVSPDWTEFIFCMNETFLVSLEVSKLQTSHSRIRVLCFDPEVAPVNASSEVSDEDSSSGRDQTWLAGG